MVGIILKAEKCEDSAFLDCVGPARGGLSNQKCATEHFVRVAYDLCSKNKII